MIRVFDTGALIGIERRDQRISQIYRQAVHDKQPMVVPLPVVGEWWRGRTDRRETILASVTVERLDRETVQSAGVALARTEPPKGRRISIVDAIVMATAARMNRTGDVVVYTSDFDDLSRLQSTFPGVRVLSVSVPS